MKIEVWWSSEKQPGDGAWFQTQMAVPYLLSKQDDILAVPPGHYEGTTIAINPNVRYQEMLGIGTSMEETTVYNLAKMSDSVRTEVLRKLVDPEQGIGLNLIRIAFGTADFTARKFYTYHDLPKNEIDFTLSEFSISKDIEYKIVDTVKEILRIAPQTKIFASPWSPPGWMKTSDSIVGGRLKEGEEYIQALAVYYRKAVQAYEEQGIPIYAMTLQNEPLLEIEYPSCLMTPEQQRDLAVALKKEFAEHGLHTKIWIFDHNFSEAWQFVAPILNDQEGFEAADGIALHDYSGEPVVMNELYSAYPSKTIHLTERSLWGTYGADRIVQFFRNHASSYNAWVTMLDSNIGTHQWVGTPGPTFFIQDADQPDRYKCIPEYYLLGQFSKFIQRGARRIDSTEGSSQTVTNVAFLNPDQTVVVVAVNQTDEAQPIRLVCEGMQAVTSVPANSVATYKWSLKF
jgi:glucosylceramidase